MSDLLNELNAGEYQRPIEALAEREWDVVIAGAGPAGGIAALYLAREGHRVLLLDKARFPREKVCGDAISGAGLGALARTGLLEAARGLGRTGNIAHIYSPSGARLRFTGDYLTLERRTLDALIAHAAAEAGAAFHQGEVLETHVQRDGSYLLQVEGLAQPVAARVLVVATGAALRLARAAGVRVRQRPTAAGMRCYVRSSLPIQELIGAYRKNITPGYGWIFPLGNGLFNVGAIVFLAYRRRTPQEMRESLASFLREFAAARELLAYGERIAPPKGAVLRCGLGSSLIGRGNALAIGEAAACTLPLSGEGIGKAMQTGELAARVINEALRSQDFGRLREYPRELRRKLNRHYRAMRRAERWMARPWVNDKMMQWASRAPVIEDALAGLIRETHDPREVFSVRGFLRTVWAGAIKAK